MIKFHFCYCYSVSARVYLLSFGGMSLGAAIETERNGGDEEVGAELKQLDGAFGAMYSNLSGFGG